MDREIEFLNELGNQLRRVVREEAAADRSVGMRWRRRLQIRPLPALAMALLVAVGGLTFWALAPQGNVTQRLPQDGRELPGPAEAGLLLPPIGQELLAVDAAAGNDVWAVGGGRTNDTGVSRSLILHWDGSEWARIAGPDVGMLIDVAAVSDESAWAISGDTILRWDGSSWDISPQPLPEGAYLSSIDASGINDAWAVGVQPGAEWVDEQGESNVGYDTLTMHWDGSRWTVVPSPNAAPRHNDVEAVLALSPVNAWVVGYSEGDRPRTFTMHWDGSKWEVIPSPDPGSEFNVLWGIGTDGVGGIWAVGHYGYEEPGSRLVALYLRWTDSQWEIISGPSGDATHQTPTALSGTSANDSWAVGSEPTSSFLVAGWDGSTWTASEAELPTADVSATLLSDVVAVSRSDAWAVGRYDRYPVSSEGRGESLILILHWDGVAWRATEAT